MRTDELKMYEFVESLCS